MRTLSLLSCILCSSILLSHAKADAVQDVFQVIKESTESLCLVSYGQNVTEIQREQSCQLSYDGQEYELRVKFYESGGQDNLSIESTKIYRFIVKDNISSWASKVKCLQDSHGYEPNICQLSIRLGNSSFGNMTTISNGQTRKLPFLPNVDFVILETDQQKGKQLIDDILAFSKM